MGEWWTTLLWCVLSGVVALLVAVAVDMALLPRSRFHTWRTLILTYLVRRAFHLVAWHNRRTLSARYASFYNTQEEFVMKTLKRHADSTYGRDFRFFDVHSLEDFRRLHPVTEYSHYQPYIDRVMEGNVRAMFHPGEEITAFFCSSGTTGVSKYIPMTKRVTLAQAVAMFGALDFFPWNLRNIITLPVATRWKYSPTGVRVGSTSAFAQSSPVIACQCTMLPKANIFTTASKALHVGLVLALRDSQACIWDAGFVFTLWNQLHFMENNWPSIVDDIRCGRLSPALDVTEQERRTIDSLLIPDPERATRLQREFERGFGGIVPRVLPHVEKVMAMCSGTSMNVYIERCRPYLGKLKISSAMYGGSESILGVNINNPGEKPAYAMLPGLNFIEFLPVDESGDAEDGATPLLASEVQMDQLYEVVLTSAAGLYRYRMGDVVRVVGSFHGTPTVDFQFRAKQMLNVHMEKVSEAAFTGALRRSVDGWPDHQLVDFTTAESVLDPAAADSADSPPHYLVLVELSGPSLPPQQAADIDKTLQNEHSVYRSFRAKSSIGPMRVVCVRPGTFAGYRQHVFDTTQTTMSQFKQPRVLRTEEQVKFFLNRAISTE
ncbi:probable indole-3-acetic acid-amido synthetase GH3.9 [Amphibalanus amphitrite]|uniref:probable indole-3-acetic acid-amido synthetase GH3.9 n=1 Tax=Amphibalanus amphitrite TaxID=1232801 RepID=UPI001C9252EF|nr:probable indole-3-acetic acid-amido synthetase GH3.9 [Amphibalanus amphitrite]